MYRHLVGANGRFSRGIARWPGMAACYGLDMKTRTNTKSDSLSGPLLDGVIALDKANFAANFPAPSIGSKPLPQPDLYQDSGSGYNADFTFPQD